MNYRGQYGIHTTQISDWKKVLQSQGYELFEKQGTNVEKTQAELIERLYCQVGQLQVELDWLKKMYNGSSGFVFLDRMR